MTTAGIISEYNPFHKGHAYQVEQTRTEGFSHIIAVMSGNYVQRGEAALAHKHIRARAALLSGVDLVLELPLVWAMQPAQRFAQGGVMLLEALSCTDAISFGSESGDLQLLQRCAALLRSPEFSQALPQFLQQGLTFAAARERALRQLDASVLPCVQHPNDTLALEYLQAIHHSGSSMDALAIRRIGAAHDSSGTQDGFCSASELRNVIKNGKIPVEHMPAPVAQLYWGEQQAGRLFTEDKRTELALLSRLRSLAPEDFARLPDCSEGIERRIYRAVQQGCTLEELYQIAKTKRYTHARIRRIVWNAALGVREQDYRPSPPYLRVLGMNPRGQELLRQLRKTAALPIVMRASHIKRLDTYAQRIFELESRATDFFNLLLPCPLPCGLEYTENVQRVELVNS